VDAFSLAIAAAVLDTATPRASAGVTTSAVK
jgi:hypothetical protein